MLLRQSAHHAIQLFNDGARRRRFDGGANQAIHLTEQRRILRRIKLLQMPQVTLILIQRTQQRITFQMPPLPALQHARHAGLQLVAALNNAGHQPRFLLCQRGGRQLFE